MNQRTLERWHRELAEVVGEMSQIIVKKGLHVRHLVTWQERLDAVSKEMGEEL